MKERSGYGKPNPLTRFNPNPTDPEHIGTGWLLRVADMPYDVLDDLLFDKHSPTQGWDIAGLVDE